MLSQKELFEAICECATEADALVEEYLKKYVERRLDEEIAVLTARFKDLPARITALEDHLTRPKR